MFVANPVRYFEIPVANLDRAIAFYEAVFDLDLERQTVDGYPMALFPYEEDGSGATGALAQGDVYVPSQSGTIVYFQVDHIGEVLERATSLGGSVLYPKKHIGAGGYVAEIADSEGNRIALTQPA
ncbi:MAG: VOC family protein [Hyphomonadaceae bacterium]|nr:VOC family protein [Hyphomonadaceae bacterium]